MRLIFNKLLKRSPIFYKCYFKAELLIVEYQ